MSSTQTQCQYKVLGDSDYKCPYPVERDAYCIFHMHTRYGDDFKKFNDGISTLLENQTGGAYDFRGFRFPSINFSGKVFEKPLLLDQAVFNCRLEFHKSRFSQKVDLRHAAINDWFVLSDVEFNDGVDMLGTVCREPARFFHVKFHNASFFKTTFQSVLFEDSHFTGMTLFNKTVFLEPADFISSTFQLVYFVETEFDQRVLFQEGDFFKHAEFTGAIFNCEAIFKGTIGKKVFRDDAIFGSLKIGKEAHITFEKINLSKASFLDTNLERITFRDVEWTSRKKFWGCSGKALWDESRPLEQDEERDYEKIAENYRQLVLNHERKRDYDAAEDFHIGEMAMRRKKKGASIKWLWLRPVREQMNAYNLYRLLSYYGTSYWQAVFGLLAFLFLLPFGYCSTDYWQGFLRPLSILTFQRPAEQLDRWSRFWLSISVIVLTAQVALVLLAIRRRFKR